MQCRNGDLCPCKSAVRREEAVCAVCDKLQELIEQDRELIGEIIARSKELDSRGDEGLLEEIKQFENRERSLTRRIDGLSDLVGEGSEEDRRETKAKIRAARTERSSIQTRLARTRKTLERSSRTLTSDDIKQILNEFASLLIDGAAGQLGEDAIYKALAVFRRLIGGRIWVHVEKRSARKQSVVRGVFRPQLIQAACDAAGVSLPHDRKDQGEVEVWLREPPLIDRLAKMAYELIDGDGLSYRQAAKVMQQEGHNVNSGKVWQLRHRFYEMIGQPVPQRPYNNGSPREST